MAFTISVPTDSVEIINNNNDVVTVDSKDLRKLTSTEYDLLVQRQESSMAVRKMHHLRMTPNERVKELKRNIDNVAKNYNGKGSKRISYEHCRCDLLGLPYKSSISEDNISLFDMKHSVHSSIYQVPRRMRLI